jgi:hypothetical protein
MSSRKEVKMATQANTSKLSGIGRVFRAGKEISLVHYNLAHERGHSQRIISGLLKVIKGRTDLLGSGSLTLFLDNGKQVNFGVSIGNLRSFEFIMDIST